MNKKIRHMFILDNYIDKEGKQTVYVRFNSNSSKRRTTRIKIKKEHFTAKKRVKAACLNSLVYNNRLDLIDNHIKEYLNRRNETNLDDLVGDVSNLIKSLPPIGSKAYVTNDGKMKGKKPVTFIDLFAGAGGFSEGFLQAWTSNKCFEFILASDIDENCELTHKVRYNYQLGLPAEFLRKDITDDDYVETLRKRVGKRDIDVVVGGPPCQSFSLAGKRLKFDRKNDLFYHYLKVIRALRPKYFVMENVKGIVSKEKGMIRKQIIDEIKSIVDLNKIDSLGHFVNKHFGDEKIAKALMLRIKDEGKKDSGGKNSLPSLLLKEFNAMVSSLVDYKTSKTDYHVNTARHGLSLLLHGKDLLSLRQVVLSAKSNSDIYNDMFEGHFDNFLGTIEVGGIINRITHSLRKIGKHYDGSKQANLLIQQTRILDLSLNECLCRLGQLTKGKLTEDFDLILNELYLYRVGDPIHVNAADYGVPQNRNRVLFIGCRRDQPLINEKPRPTTPKDKVSIQEAIHDLDFLGNNDEKRKYVSNGKMTGQGMEIKKREQDGKTSKKARKTYSGWRKSGRLGERFLNKKKPVYARNQEDYLKQKFKLAELHNHKTSNQNEIVRKRLQLIIDAGGYDNAREKLEEEGILTSKRNYTVLKRDQVSPTVCTLPDDLIHYSKPRAPTVREVARLQSFDDDFVMQGKRTTGGDKRKQEIPQYTLVGNAVPPLMAKAIGDDILKNI